MFWRQLCEKYLHSGLVWPALRHILSEYGYLLCKSPYTEKCQNSVQMPKKSRTRKIIALLAYIEYYSVKEFTTSSAFHI